MRNRLLTTLLFTALLTAVSASPASASGYVAVEGTSITVENNLDGELNPLGLRFRMGMPIGENLDMEGHFGFGGDDRDSSYDEFSSTYGGIYLKGYVPIGYNSAFYAMGGWAGVSLTQTVNGSDFSDERYGFSFGAGFETKISERVDLTADYMSYVRDEGLFEDVSAVSFGLKFYF